MASVLLQDFPAAPADVPSGKCTEPSILFFRSSRNARINTVPDISAHHSRNARIHTVSDISAHHSHVPWLLEVLVTVTGLPGDSARAEARRVARLLRTQVGLGAFQDLAATTVVVSQPEITMPVRGAVLVESASCFSHLADL